MIPESTLRQIAEHSISAESRALAKQLLEAISLPGYERLAKERDAARAEVDAQLTAGKALYEAVQKLMAENKRLAKQRDNWLDCVHAMLVAAGAPEDIDEMEAEVKSAGNKPSDYIEHVVGSMRGILRRLRNDCGSMVFGHDAELVDDILSRSPQHIAAEQPKPAGGGA